MNEEKKMVEEGFYREVARILGCEQEHEYRPFPYSKRTRWNHRMPGNGRYPGHGMVRRYSSGLIHVALKDPPLSGTYGSDADAIAAIRTALNSNKTEGNHAHDIPHQESDDR
jgi:hypothetical protein